MRAPSSPEEVNTLCAIHAQLDTMKTQLGVVEFYRDEILKLYMHWNSLQPVSQPPPEVLLEIFKTYIAHYEEHGPPRWVTITITHVCRQWRSLAVDYPTFWTSIDLYAGAAYLQAILPRTKTAPLKIFTPACAFHRPFPDDVKPILEALLARETSRIQQLSLIGVSLSTKLRSTPILRKLGLDNMLDSDIDLAMFSDIIYGDAAPSLEEIWLNGFDWTHRPIHHPNLKHFTFHGAGIVVSVEELISTLKHSPLLETLVLSGCLSYHMDRSEPAYDGTASLEHLRAISLHSNITTGLNLLSCMSIPSIEEIFIGGRRDGEVTHSSAMADFSWLAWMKLEYCSLTFENNFWYATLRKTPKQSPKLRFRGPTPEIPWEPAPFKTFCNTLPLSQIVGLSFSSILAWQWDAVVLRELFAQLPNLQTLELDGNRDLFPHMSALLLQSEPSNSTPFLPSLKNPGVSYYLLLQA